MNPAIKIPQQQLTPLTPGANSPQQSSFMSVQNMNQTQTALNNAAQGGKKKKKGGGIIEISPTSTASYNVNGIVKQTATGDITSQVNSVGDKGAFVKGGSKKRKSRRKQRRKQSRKQRRSRRYYK